MRNIARIKIIVARRALEASVFNNDNSNETCLCAWHHLYRLMVRRFAFERVNFISQHCQLSDICLIRYSSTLGSFGSNCKSRN